MHDVNILRRDREIVVAAGSVLSFDRTVELGSPAQGTPSRRLDEQPADGTHEAEPVRVVIRGENGSRVVLQAPQGKRLFDVFSGHLVLQNVVIQGSGRRSGAPEDGGCVRVLSGQDTSGTASLAMLTVVDATFRECAASDMGGALLVSGTTSAAALLRTDFEACIAGRGELPACL